MNNRYNELDNTLKTNIDSLINTLASCQNETQNEEIFNEIIKDAFVEINKNHQCYLRYKETETIKINEQVKIVCKNISKVLADNTFGSCYNSYEHKKILIDPMIKRLVQYQNEIKAL